jgi:hypothetical protein
MTHVVIIGAGECGARAEKGFDGEITSSGPSRPSSACRRLLPAGGEKGTRGSRGGGLQSPRLVPSPRLNGRRSRQADEGRDSEPRRAKRSRGVRGRCGVKRLAPRARKEERA